MEGGGERSHRRACVPDLDLGDAEIERPFDDQRRGAGLDGRGGVIVPVGVEAADAEEEGAWDDGTAVVGEARDLHRLVAANLAGDARGADQL